MDASSQALRLYSLITKLLADSKKNRDDARSTTVEITNIVMDWITAHGSQIRIALDLWISSRYEEWEIALAMPDGSRMEISSGKRLGA